MKKLVIAMIFCMCVVAGAYISGYCQDDCGSSLESEMSGAAYGAVTLTSPEFFLN